MSSTFYRIPMIPDLTMAKYTAEENNNVEDVLKQQALFFRQLNRRGLLFGESYRFIITYRPDDDPGNRIHIWFEVVDGGVGAQSLDSQIAASPLSAYFSFQKIGLCESDNTLDAIAPTELSDLPYTAWAVKQAGEMASGNNPNISGLYLVDEWKMNDNARLIGLYRLLKAINQPCRYVVHVTPCNYSQKVRFDFEFQTQWIRNYVNGLDRNSKDDNADYVLKQYSKFIDCLRSNPHYQCRISASSNNMAISKMLLDVVASECVEEGGYEIIESEEIEDPNAPMGMNWWRTVFTVKEVAPFMALPTLYPGETIDIPKESAPDHWKGDSQYILLGKELLTNYEEGYDVWVELGSLSKHAFLAGVPGGGKTRSMEHLIYQLSIPENNVPFLVLEPAKKEYRSIIGNESECLADVTVFSPGGLGSFMLRINPFEFPIGMPLSEHMTSLMQVFEGAFDLEAPFPMLLIEGIEAVYRTVGWYPEDINTGEKEYPTMTMLFEQLAIVLEHKYAGDVKENMRSVLEVRIGSLIRGEMGNVFDVAGSTLKPDEWLTRKCIVELEALGKDGANFLTLLLCTLVREYLRHHPKYDRGKLRHVIFIEEAHNVIGPSTMPGGGYGNTKIASTRFIVDMLAEVRALKEGIVIADQLPTALAEQVTKNTALKIAHKMTAMDDRQILGATMSMDAVQMEQMAFFQPGESLCIYDSVKKPFRVQICDCVAEEGMRDESPDNDELYTLLKDRECYIHDMKRDWELMIAKYDKHFTRLSDDANSAYQEYYSNLEVSKNDNQPKDKRNEAIKKKSIEIDRAVQVLNDLQELLTKLANYVLRNKSMISSDYTTVGQTWTKYSKKYRQICGWFFDNLEQRELADEIKSHVSGLKNNKNPVKETMRVLVEQMDRVGKALREQCEKANSKNVEVLQ